MSIRTRQPISQVSSWFLDQFWTNDPHTGSSALSRGSRYGACLGSTVLYGILAQHGFMLPLPVFMLFFEEEARVMTHDGAQGLAACAVFAVCMCPGTLAGRIHRSGPWGQSSFKFQSLYSTGIHV